MDTCRRIGLVLLLLTTPGRAADELDFEIPIRRGGLANTFERLSAGQSLRIVYIGGSVTEMEGWRTNTTAWFASRYPGRITDVNAGWSGTGSAIGALRFERDVLSHNPDLVFVEFAINDETGDSIPFIMRNMEGMARQAWRHNPMMDLCLVETISFYQEPAYLAGNLPNTVDAHYRVADHYAIPSVNVGWALYEHVLAGTPWTDLAPDRVHPNEAGHRIYSDALTAFLESERLLGESEALHPLPAPLTPYPLENPEVVELGELTLLSGWTRRTGEFGVPSYALTSEIGAEISLSFQGPTAVLKFIRNPDGGTVGCSIDGSGFTPIDLHHGWAWVWAIPIAKELSFGSHSIRLRNLSQEGVVRLATFESAAPPGTPTPTPQPTPIGDAMCVGVK